MTKLRICRGIGLFFTIAGPLHFLNPQPFISIVPSWLPHPGTLVLISGMCEIAGGMGLWIPRLRLVAGWGLIALLAAVFPANIYMLTQHPYLLGHHIPAWVLWLRLPLQPALMLLIGWCIYRHPNNLSPAN